MHQLTLGVVAHSRKAGGCRLPIHPRHGLRGRIHLEHGYGEDFGVPDAQPAGVVAGLRTREQLIAECDILLLAKPLPQDVAELRPGQATYYTVDHSPSYLWNSATGEISEPLLPFLETVLGGPSAWDGDESVGRAIEIRDGVVRNPAVLAFQHRAAEYPYLVE